MSWRLAKSLDILREQANIKWPQRSRVADGTIGDADHASRDSDHNPWVMDGRTGVVTALDITHDPLHGLDSHALAEALLASRDHRIKYVISNRKIASGDGGPQPWKWRKYTGKNAHNHHVHLSVKADKRVYDLTTPWNLDAVAEPDPKKPVALIRPRLRRGSTGKAVRELQTLLGVTADGIYGQMTEKAVQAKQKSAGLVADGIVGPYTWELLT